MAWQHLIEVALQSPVLVAAIIGLVGLTVANGVNRLKDDQIKTKDDEIVALKGAHAAELKVKDQQIAALERWTPAKMMEQVEAIKQLWELRAEQLTAEVEDLSTKLEEGRDLSALEREQIQEELDQAHQELKNSRIGHFEAEQNFKIFATLTEMERKIDSQLESLIRPEPRASGVQLKRREIPKSRRRSISRGPQSSDVPEPGNHE